MSDAQIAEFVSKAAPELVAATKFECEAPETLAGRLIRACKGNVAEALQRLADTAAWRRSRDVEGLRTKLPDDILGGPSEDELAAFDQHVYLPVQDKLGRAVFIQRAGLVDAESVLRLTDLDKLEDYHIYCNEVHMGDAFARASAATGKPISSLLTILDMEGMSMSLISSSARSYVARTSAIDTAYYPETLGAMYIINAPAIFSTAWNIVKGFLDKGTVAKINILGGPSTWKPELAKVLAPEATPVEYGGTLVVPGGLWAPTSTVTTKLSSGAVHRVVVAAKAGQSVRFRWFARSSGVKFGLTFVPTPGAAPVFVGNTTTGSLPGVQEAVKEVGMCGEGFSGAVAVLALKEYEDSGKGAIHAEHTAPAAGWWVATWDNHKGWRGKEITHRWDYLVNGVPECSLVAAERSRRDTAAAAAGKAAAAAAAASTGGSAATATA